MNQIPRARAMTGRQIVSPIIHACATSSETGPFPAAAHRVNLGRVDGSHLGQMQRAGPKL